MTSEIVIAPGRIVDAPGVQTAREGMRKARLDYALTLMEEARRCLREAGVIAGVTPVRSSRGDAYVLTFAQCYDPGDDPIFKRPLKKNGLPSARWMRVHYGETFTVLRNPQVKKGTNE